MKTFIPKYNTINHKWYIIDANGKILGRLATEIARILRGKHKIEYTPHIDTGDYIIVVNAEKIITTGKKYLYKIYYKHSGYIGGLKKQNLNKMILNYPEKVIEIAVKGMLPKNKLGNQMLKKLKVYSGNNHKHIAQNPKLLMMK